jgi:Uma2 family endonuclease
MAHPALKPPSPDADPFYWGSRLVRVETGGGTELKEVPLRREDVLDPREGDMMVHGPKHGYFIRTLADMLDRWLGARDFAVFDDVKILWGRPDVPEVAPDVSVIRGVRDKWKSWERSSFSVPEEGVTPCLVIEVISERYREIDERDKVRIYQRAGVPEYLIVDVTTTPVELTGYRLDRSGRYRRHGSKSRWASRTTGLRFRSGSGDLELLVEDVATGKRLLTSVEEAAARRVEAMARRVAEEARRREASARQAEAAARREAERRAEAAEAELERVQRELERLRGSGPA